MNTTGPRADDAYRAALQSYRSTDPISLRLLVDAVEGRARRMRAEATRELIAGFVRWICRKAADLGASAQPIARRERLSA